MSNPNSIRCEHCNLLNFADSAHCKRCRNPFQTDKSSVININVNVSSPVQQVNINTNGESFQPHRIETQAPRLPEPNRIEAQTPHPPMPPSRLQMHAAPKPSEQIDDDGYQTQNQTGLDQWKQLEQNQRPPQRPNMPPYPVQYQPAGAPFHPGPQYQMMMPAQMMVPSVWRYGNDVVVHKLAVMPDTCVKCNQYIAGGGYSTQKYRWHNPLVYIALISPLIYFILSLAMSQRGSVAVPLCHEHKLVKEKTGKNLLMGGVGAFTAFVLGVAFGYPGFAFLVFLVGAISLGVGHEYFYKPLRISKIENEYLYLKGACQEYLEQLQHGG